MTQKSKPEMSVILVTPGDYRTLKLSMKALRAQTIHHMLEILIVSPSPEKLILDDLDKSAFHSVKILKYNYDRLMSRARAMAVRHATADIVAMAEDHSDPEPNWAESMLNRHNEGYAVVGPEMINGNPETALSWSSFLIAYSRWAHPANSEEIDHVPGHNSSYKRKILLNFGEELDTLLAAESVLHWEIKSSGNKIFLENRAKTHHVNFSLFIPYTKSVYYQSRVFADIWSRNWTLSKRFYFCLISPLIIFKQLIQLIVGLPKFTKNKINSFYIYPHLFIGSLAKVLGFSIGLSLGMGNAIKYDWDYEMDRGRFLSKMDKS